MGTPPMRVGRRGFWKGRGQKGRPSWSLKEVVLILKAWTMQKKRGLSGRMEGGRMECPGKGGAVLCSESSAREEKGKSQEGNRRRPLESRVADFCH